MSWASEEMIETHNERMATDEDYAASYDEQMRIDAYVEFAFFERERELEKFEEFFDDKLIDVHGATIELPEPEAVFLIDDDIPF